MPLVFVHGIGNRPGARYQTSAAARDRLFEQCLFPVIRAVPGVDRVYSPVWGPLAGTLRWNGASLPGNDLEQLGGTGDDDLRDEVAATEDVTDPDRIACRVARRSLADAVDLLFGLLPADSWSPAVAEAAAGAVAYCRHEQRLRPGLAEEIRHPWLADVERDNALVDALLARSAQWRLSPRLEPVRVPGDEPVETMGGGAGSVRDLLVRGMRRLRHHVVGVPVTTLASAARRAASRHVTELAGDVLTYVAQRGTPEAPGPIVRAVLTGLDEAVRDNGAGRPLVVVAHSMGGNIMYDVLTHFRPGLSVDVLVTVGSQVGLFAELGLFPAHGSRPAGNGAQPLLDRPSGVTKWINVVDRADILSYGVGRIVARTTDYHYPTDALWAHSAYFRQPAFHLRLAERVSEALA